VSIYKDHKQIKDEKIFSILGCTPDIRRLSSSKIQHKDVENGQHLSGN
jgi:hypothetical protein